MNLRARLSTLIAARVVLSTLLLGSAVLVQVNRPGALPVNPLFFLIGITYALSVGYIFTLRYADRHRWMVDVQLAGDALIVSAFIYITGGVTSYFSSLYVLPIIAASTLRQRRGAMQVAALSAVLYFGLVAAQYLEPAGYLPGGWSTGAVGPLPTLRVAQYTVAINLFGFFAVAALSGSLAEGLRTADARLEHASHEIADLRAFNQYVIESLHSGLVTADQAGRVLTFNKAAAVITGVPLDEAVGRDAGELLQLPSDYRARLGDGGATRGLRFEIEYRSGQRTIDLGLTATPLRLPDGPRGFLFTFQDVTDVKRLERSARLQQRLAAVGEMAAGIAHEIRNPLASMSGSIQVLRHELPLTEEQAQLMDIVLRESERLNDTIRSFLAYARPQRFAVTRLDLRKTLQDTALLIRHGSEVKDGHVVEVGIEPGPVWFEADENQIRQIIWNLASNSLRAMPDGGRLRLAVAGDPRAGSGGEVVLTVEDEGRGIPQEELDAIFQPFRGSFEKGTGLGLAIVHRIATDYGGTIQVTSTVGAGTTVRVRLPVRPAAEGTVAARVTAGEGAVL